MEQVEKQRRRNRLITIGAISLIAVVIVAVVIALPKSSDVVVLPGYLDRCVTATLLYHAHISLNIVINGSTFTIPSGVGIQGACIKPLHTHATDNTIHVETDQDRDYTLQDFFLIWGNWANSAQTAIFNSTQIFGSRAVGGHTLTMTVTVNGASSPSTAFQNYVIPRDAQTSCSGVAPPCETISVAITYL